MVCAQLFYRDDVNRCSYELGRYNSDLAFTGLYKLLVRMASPQMIPERAAKIINDYYRGLTAHVYNVTKGQGFMQLRGFSEPLPVVEQRIVGFVESAFMKCSAKNIQVKVIRSSSGTPDDYSEFQATWSS